MADVFIDFVKYVYDALKDKSIELDDKKKKYLADYLKEKKHAGRLLKDNSKLLFDFATQLNIKFEDLSDFDVQIIAPFLKNGLFEINEKNVELYSKQYGSEEFRFSCFEENKYAFSYIVSESAGKFVKAMISLMDGDYLHERSSFLLKLLYCDCVDCDYKPGFIDEFEDYSIDYFELYKSGSLWISRLDFMRDCGDDFCFWLAKESKLMPTWNTLIIAAHQMRPSDDAMLNVLINVSLRDHENVLEDSDVAPSLEMWAKNFYQYIFKTEDVDAEVVHSFSRKAGGKFFSIPQVLCETYLNDEKPTADAECQKWNADKCAFVLRSFIDASYNCFSKNVPLICYLVKNNVGLVLDLFEKKYALDGEVFPEDENDSENVFWKLPNERKVYIYSSLLLNWKDEKSRDPVLNLLEVIMVLQRINVDMLLSILSDWAITYKDEYEGLVKNIFSKYDFLREKFYSPNSIAQHKSITLLSNLVGVIDDVWVKDVLVEDIRRNRDILKKNYGNERINNRLYRNWMKLIDYFKINPWEMS